MRPLQSANSCPGRGPRGVGGAPTLGAGSRCRIGDWMAKLGIYTLVARGLGGLITNRSDVGPKRLMNVTVGGISPPFGYVIFAFQGAADKVTISEAFNAAWPFVALFLLGMVALAVFPPLVTFLPSLL